MLGKPSGNFYRISGQEVNTPTQDINLGYVKYMLLRYT